MSGGRFRVESVQSDEKPSQGSQDEALTTSITSLPPPPPNGRPTAGPAHGASAAVLAKWSKGWCGAPPKSPPLCRSMLLQHFVEPLTDGGPPSISLTLPRPPTRICFTLQDMSR
ncbi:hypothetical protein WR25_22374 [Diploscapter pachys]|uniref:Uncharacterized protein n=1 Tax=Diploscapter pachys TaxID=2018661 RepID=A0A2A2L4N6_9BILA|nr:hypothetical protein WR25_22374 [Diploscapter pachys]